jgi:hypothetical protein
MVHFLLELVERSRRKLSSEYAHAWELSASKCIKAMIPKACLLD